MEKKFYSFSAFFEWYMRNATVKYETETEILAGYKQELLRGNKLILENKKIDKDIFLIDYLK